MMGIEPAPGFSLEHLNSSAISIWAECLLSSFILSVRALSSPWLCISSEPDAFCWKPLRKHFNFLKAPESIATPRGPWRASCVRRERGKRKDVGMAKLWVNRNPNAAQANISLLIPFAVFLLFSYSVLPLRRHRPPQPVRWAGTLLVRSCYPQPMGLAPVCESPGKVRFLHQVISVYSNWIMGTPALSSLLLCSASCSQGQALSHIT